jgi:hypothetical protein
VVAVTNANLPERWLNDLRFRRDQLSDAAYRGYMNALMWSVANRTDGVIRPQDLKYIPDFDHGVIRGLVNDDLWQPRGPNRGWLIADFATTQTSRDLVEKYEREKALDRARKARKAKEAAAEKLAKLAALNTGAELCEQDFSGGNSAGSFPAESPSTEQTKLRPGHEGRGTARSDGEKNSAELDLCWDCRVQPPLGARAKGFEDAALCRDCNEARILDLKDQRA